MQAIIDWFANNPPALTALATLLGGLMAATVAVLTSWMSHHYTAKREAAKLLVDERRDAEKVAREASESRRILLRSHLERVCALVHEHVAHEEERHRQFSSLLLSHSYGIEHKDEDRPAGATALAEARTLCLLYLPSLGPQIFELQQACAALAAFHGEEIARHQADKLGWKGEPASTLTERMSSVNLMRILAVGQFEQAARELVEELLPSSRPLAEPAELPR